MHTYAFKHSCTNDSCNEPHVALLSRPQPKRTILFCVCGPDPEPNLVFAQPRTRKKMHSRIDIRTCTSHFIMGIMGPLFLGDLSSAAAAAKCSSRRALEACDCGDRAFGHARLGHCGIEVRMPAVHTPVAPPRTRRPLPGGDRKLRRVVHLSSAQTNFPCPLIPWTAPWPAKVRGKFGLVSAGRAPSYRLSERMAANIRMCTENTRLGSTLVSRVQADAP